jgi:esterase/lipase superfamily enzyme
MTAKGMPHTLDVWGDGAGHDWPWWEKMVQKFL